VTTDPLRDRQSASDAVAGLLASSALFISLLALAYRPMRLIPAAVILSLVAAAMSERYNRLVVAAATAAAVCWVVGVTIAIATKNPLF
jgi:hypothetical protein